MNRAVPPGNQAWRKATGNSAIFRNRNSERQSTTRLCGTIILIGLTIFTVLMFFTHRGWGHHQKPVAMVGQVQAAVGDENEWFDDGDRGTEQRKAGPPQSDIVDHHGATNAVVTEKQQRALTDVLGTPKPTEVAGFSTLRFRQKGCNSRGEHVAQQVTGSEQGDMSVEFLRVAPARTPLGAHLAQRHRAGGSHIVSFTPQLSDSEHRYVASDALLDVAPRRAQLTLLSDSLRVVVAPILANNASGSALGNAVGSSSVDTHVTCDAEDHDQPSTFSWSYDVGGSGGSATIGVRFEEKEHHAVDVTATFPKKSKMILLGPASRGAGIKLASGRSFPLRNLDVNHYRLADDANIYGSVPLVYAVDLASEHKYTVGLFWLNSASMNIRTGRESDNGGIESVTFASEAGAGTLYILPGPTAADVLVQYFSLTGAPQLPPLFSLGYHQCRWSYKDQADVTSVNDKFTEHNIPFDTIWLDIDHTNDKRYFTWDSRKFPDSTAMIKHLVASGRKLVTISDPHIKADPGFFVFREARDQKFLIAKSAVGQYAEFHGHCWPGESAWIDFANPKARDWYATLFSPDKYVGSTLDVFTWNDMNEPSVFSGPQITMPGDAGQTNGVTYYQHKELHNMYGFHQTQATFAGHLYRSHNNQRPFLLTRSFFAGSQRYAAVWTGDNQANWDHLRGSIAMLMMHSMSGIVFIGADVGGFFDDPSEELHVRWFQLGCLYPFFRGHSHEQTRRREPWLYPAPIHSNIAAAIRFRYTLLPYLYATFFEAHRFGAPIWRPRFFEFPEDASSYETVDAEESVLVGGALLAIPAVHQGQSATTTTLPKESAFYNWWTGELYPGGATVHFPVSSVHEFSDTNPVVPLLLRAGTGISTLADSADQLLSSSATRSSTTGESNSLHAHNDVALVFALDATCSAEALLYHDDGVSTDFAKSTKNFCTRSAVASMVGSSTLSINITTAAEHGPFATTTGNAPIPAGGRRSGMQRLAGNCDLAHGILEGLGRMLPIGRPFRYFNIKRVRVMTGLCPRIPEGATFAAESFEYQRWSNATTPHAPRLGERSTEGAYRSWTIKQVSEHIFEASGAPLSDAAWELTWRLS